MLHRQRLRRPFVALLLNEAVALLICRPPSPEIFLAAPDQPIGHHGAGGVSPPSLGPTRPGRLCCTASVAEKHVARLIYAEARGDVDVCRWMAPPALFDACSMLSSRHPACRAAAPLGGYFSLRLSGQSFRPSMWSRFIRVRPSIQRRCWPSSAPYARSGSIAESRLFQL